MCSDENYQLKKIFPEAALRKLSSPKQGDINIIKIWSKIILNITDVSSEEYFK
jgi:hypothetical protein